MNRMFLIFLWLIGFVITPGAVIAVNTTCMVQSFDQKHLNDFRKSKEFKYEAAAAENDGFLGSLLLVISRFFEKINGVHVGRISLYDVFFYGIIVFAAVALILQLFKVQITGLFTKSDTAVVSHRSFVENVHELDFDTLIEEAKNQSNYRLATRLYYLKTLKRLSDSGLINWQKNKTNFEYYYELKGEERRKQFYNLTRLFESVWYGNLEISETTFNENLETFTGFLQTIKR